MSIENNKKETIDIDYEIEYARLKRVEAENIELKDTIINMTKIVFTTLNELSTTIKDIERELKTLSRRK